MKIDSTVDATIIPLWFWLYQLSAKITIVTVYPRIDAVLEIGRRKWNFANSWGLIIIAKKINDLRQAARRNGITLRINTKRDGISPEKLFAVQEAVLRHDLLFKGVDSFKQAAASYEWN